MAEVRSEVRAVSLRSALATAARSAAGSLALTGPRMMVPSDLRVARRIWCATMSLAE